MSEWVTDRRPTIEDSTIEGEFVLIKIGPNTVQGAHYTRVGDYPWRSLSNTIAKHTPGPWKWVVKRYLMWRKFSLLGQNGCEVMSFGVDDSGTMEMVGEEPSEADARMIAAAPELLAAAKNVITRWDSPLWKMEEHTAEFINKLREAVAKCEVMP